MVMSDQEKRLEKKSKSKIPLNRGFLLSFMNLILVVVFYVDITTIAMRPSSTATLLSIWSYLLGCLCVAITTLLISLMLKLNLSHKATILFTILPAMSIFDMFSTHLVRYMAPDTKEMNKILDLIWNYGTVTQEILFWILTAITITNLSFLVVITISKVNKPWKLFPCAGFFGIVWAYFVAILNNLSNSVLLIGNKINPFIYTLFSFSITVGTGLVLSIYAYKKI